MSLVASFVYDGCSESSSKSQDVYKRVSIPLGKKKSIAWLKKFIRENNKRIGIPMNYKLDLYYGGVAHCVTYENGDPFIFQYISIENVPAADSKHKLHETVFLFDCEGYGYNIEDIYSDELVGNIENALNNYIDWLKSDR